MFALQLDFLGIPIFAFLCGVGILLLSLSYLNRSPCFPLFWKQREINQVSKPESLRDIKSFQIDVLNASSALATSHKFFML